ncbi:acetyl-CoA synthetase-like protein [Gymnopus androsaceus JB14]|uniref:Acetyl-CoA synthetase-like protein n=1 Tax=Gymnopus androsaceus JB14 TaxID=1447944 RepID=A0A6A4I6M8_9AGAR|nr:acetyl-CoA synthetase-like protein [Gymnopus androsaceus JB14]
MAVQSKPLMSSTGISPGPIYFPPDFVTPSNSNDRTFLSVDVALLDGQSLFELKSSFNGLTTPSIIMSAFIAVLQRVTGRDDGIFAVSLVDAIPFTFTFAVESKDTFFNLTRIVAHYLSLEVQVNKSSDISQCPVLLTFTNEKSNRRFHYSTLESEWQLVEKANGITARIHFSPCFNATSIIMFADIFSRILKAAITQHGKVLTKVRIFTDADNSLLKEWNNTQTPTSHSSLNARFREVATAEASAIAVVDGSSSLTYNELDKQSDRLASWLVGLSLKSEEAVGIWMGRSALLVIAYLGCVKAGLAFMPLDKKLPVNRVRIMVQNTKCRLMLTYGDGPLAEEIETVDLMQRKEILLSTPITELPTITSHQLSNIVHTSGSTGTPKAIMIEHRSMVNLCAPETTNWPGKFNTALSTSIGFDPSGFQIFSALLGGSTLYCLPDNGLFDPKEYQEFIVQSSIQRCSMTPSVLSALLETDDDWLECSSLKHIMLGGEPLNPSKITECLRRLPTLEVSSSYGPAEAAVRSAYYLVTPLVENLLKIPIGRALPNTSIYVLDESFYPVPAGVLGEIAVAGIHLARGYLHQPELTAERFISISAKNPLGPCRLYLTGDVGYWNSEGQLQFVGRKDTQLKLRGQRIEAGEVECAINCHPAVKSSAVVVVGTPSGDQLIAYTLLSLDTSCDFASILDSIINSLRQSLPSYMIPAHIIPLDEFPLNYSGKLDRKTLSSNDYLEKFKSVKFIPTSDGPRTETEELILSIFSQALSIPEKMIGVYDNLFDLGGHSLIATHIVAAIRRQFNVSFDILAFMDNATIADTAALVLHSHVEKDPRTHIIPRNSQDLLICPASDAQTRLWIEEELNPGLARYNAGFQRKITGPLNVDALERAFLALVDRHEALRTTFSMDNGVLMQSIRPSDSVTVRVIGMGDSAESEENALKLLHTEQSRPFNLREDPPVRFAIISAGDNLFFISAIIHHISTDGWSSGIIDREVTLLYNALSAGLPTPLLPNLPLRYTDYSLWQNERLNTGMLDTQLSYWHKQLQGSKPLELHADFVRPEKLSGKADEIPFEISEESLMALRLLAATHRTSLYVVLLAAFRASIFRITGEEDGTIGMVNANRPQEEIEHIVGFFVNTHAVRLSIDSNTSFDDIVLKTRRVTAEALQHSDVPFDKVVQKCLTAQRELSRNPLVQLMFVLQDFSGVSVNDMGKGLHGVKTEEIRNPTTRLDMTIHLFVQDNLLRGYVMYQSDIFTSSTIQSVINIFQRMIVTASTQPSIPISTLVLATPLDLDIQAGWNNTNQQLVSYRSLHERFRGVVSLEGSSVAVVDDSSSITYSELDEQTDRLASWLVERGLKSEEAIGVWMERSRLLVIAYLGCLKAGLAFMPLDKRLPVDRLKLMVQSAKCRCMLTSGEGPLTDEIDSVDLTQHSEILLSTPIIDLPSVSDHQLSNIVYTSGSTGVPKAVMVEHRGMVNLCAPETTNWPGKLNTALSTSIGFDPSGFQIFSALLGGSTLYCLPDNGLFDPQEYQTFIVEYNIHRCYMTPSVLSALLETGDDWLERSSLKHIMLGGEKLNPSKISECLRRLPTLEIFSSYGPAEASVRSAFHPVTSVKNLQRIPIGRALPNTSIHILDNALCPVPAGVLGEICVSGIHLSRGYLHQPELTAQHFVETAHDSPLGFRRIYRTGDLGYWTKEGLVQFVGRKDTQLKLRGQRIEAGEVEFAINRHPSVQSSAVVTVHFEDDEQLVAYVQLEENGSSKEEGVLSLWEDLYNEEEKYDILDNDDAGHDFARWFSMFTGERIPLAEMHEWLEDTIQHIPHNLSDRCLEIGVGTGMIALNLINEVSLYVGVDVSAPSLNFLDSQIKRLGLSSKFSIMQAAAHELDLLPKHDFSLVIFNSVLQYFPSADYLTDAIGKVIAIMASTGRIFIGDVRSHALIPYHDAERMLSSLPQDASVDDGRIIMQRYGEVQTELLLSPAFFYQLQRQYSAITHVEIRPKLMKARNELSRYRYTVLLHVGSPPMLITPALWIDYPSIGSTTSSILSELRSLRGSVVGVGQIPIADVQAIEGVLDRIENSDNPIPVLRQRLSDAAKLRSTPAELKQMADEEGWDLILDYSYQGRHGNFLSAIFVPSQNRNFSEYLAGDFPLPASSESSPIHNMLTQKTADVAAVLSSLEKRLRKILPVYMVPSRIINLEQLPLNPSGKLDRKLLSSVAFFESCDITASTPKDIGLASGTELEVLAIFASALGRPQESIGIEDSLFDLGGHSLTATLVVSAVRRELGVELSMASFFRNPTVQSVAAIVEAQGRGIAQDSEIPSISDTILANSHCCACPTVFIFPESTGIPSLYSTAFDRIPYRVVAFGDSHWGQPLQPDESVESIAGTLVTEIRKIQPTGPYFLVGWSLGGYLALEAAIQLEAMGASTKMVVMIDSSVYDRSLTAAQWRPDLDHLLGILDDKEQWLAQFTRANMMISKYQTRNKAYGGRVELIKALRARSGDVTAPIDDPTNGWGSILPQIKVHGFDASHRTMFSYENGPKMGAVIAEVLKDAESVE